MSQLLEGLTSGSTYEVTVVSIRGFEESEPLTGILRTGERDRPVGGMGIEFGTGGTGGPKSRTRRWGRAQETTVNSLSSPSL